MSYYTLYVYFRNKFSVKVSTYMMELYNDKLIDLFAKPGTSDDVIFFLSFVTVDSLDFVVAQF